MYTIQWKREIPAMVLIALSFLVMLFIYPMLPDRMPIHWNIQGHVDGWAVKSWLLALMMPLISLGLYAMTLFLPFIDRSSCLLRSGSQ